MASPEPQPLASLSLFHVHYVSTTSINITLLTPHKLTNLINNQNPTDPLSHLSAYLALLPQSLLGSYILLILSTRELEALLLLSGQLACEALNFGLKRLIKEERPSLIREVKTGYGMPSSHAQFVGFWGVYVILFLWVRLRPDGDAGGVGGDASGGGMGMGMGGQVHRRRVSGGVLKNGPVSPAVLSAAAATNGDGVEWDSDGEKHASPYTHSPSTILSLQLRYPLLKNVALSVIVTTLTLATAYSRIYLSYHTPKQVLVGLLAGSSFGVAYFFFVSWLRWSGWVEWALELGIVRMARIRDLVCEEDLVEIGWRVWEEKRAARMRRRSGVGKRVRLVDPKTGNGAPPDMIKSEGRKKK